MSRDVVLGVVAARHMRAVRLVLLSAAMVSLQGSLTHAELLNDALASTYRYNPS